MDTWEEDLDDYYYEHEGDFTDYVPSTIDPGLWATAGTLLICMFILLVALVFLMCRRRRKIRKSRKIAEQQRNEDDESVEGGFARSSFRKAGSNLKAWKEIVSEIKASRTHSKRGKNHGTGVEDVLGRDLFEGGGLVDVAFGYQGSLNEDAASTSTRTRKTRSKKKKSADDYKLMEANDARENPGSCSYLGSLLSYDRETRKLLKLAIPYTISTIATSCFTLLGLAIVGHILGTRDLSAFIMLFYLLELSTMLVRGLIASITPIGSQAIGAEQHELTGKYIQIAILLSLLLYAPLIYVWFQYVDNVMLWFEYDSLTAAVAQRYAKVFVFSGLLEIINTAFFNLLDICGHEKFSATVDVMRGLVKTLATLGVALELRGDLWALTWVGIANVAVDTATMLVLLLHVVRDESMAEFVPGLFWNFALANFATVSSFLKAAVPLSIGHILSYSEWEILFLLAGVLGPAELSVWCIAGSLWSSLEELTFAWGDAAEVRCGILLGSGHADRARLTAHKSLLMGSVGAAIASGLLLGGMPFVPKWFTKDATLQLMLREVLPLIAIGNLILAFGSISWQLLGAQGRYSISTAVQFVGSWLVTIPLGALSSLYLNWNLTGLVAAIVVGYMLSGTLNFVILCCTNWKHRSKRIMAKIAKAGSNSSVVDTDSSDSDNDDNISFRKSADSNLRNDKGREASWEHLKEIESGNEVRVDDATATIASHESKRRVFRLPKPKMMLPPALGKFIWKSDKW